MGDHEQPLQRAYWAALIPCLGAILLLVAAAAIFSYIENARLEPEIRRLAQVGERSTYLIGRITFLLSRMRANTLEALTEPPGEAQSGVQRARDIDLMLEEHVRELPHLLSRDELEVWSGITGRIEGLRNELTEALGQIEQGRFASAETTLDSLTVSARRLFDMLEEFQMLNQRETATLLNAVDARLDRARSLQGGASATLIGLILIIGLVLIRSVRRAERERTQHFERMHQANRDLEDFAGRVAHDLRNVLAPLKLGGQVLGLSGREPARIEEAARRIVSAARRADDILTGLLAFSRAGAPVRGGSSPVETELRAVLEELAPLAERVGAEVRCETEPALKVACEPALLHVVLLNLVSNALKFLEGRPRRAVRVAIRQAGPSVLIEIADTGPGIPAGVREHIFEPFYRAPGVRASGTGIGLATVRRIIDAHGGSIQVESTEGLGTEFRLLLPSAPAPLQSSTVAAPVRAHTQ